MLSEAKNTKTFEHHLKLTQKTQDGGRQEHTQKLCSTRHQLNMRQDPLVHCEYDLYMDVEHSASPQSSFTVENV